MATGRDIADFISKKLGTDFVSLYDASTEKQEQNLRTEEKVRNNFQKMLNRINKVG